MTPLLPSWFPGFDALKALLLGLLEAIHSTGLTWAWSIIAMTAVVRIAIMPLTVKQTRSMLAMQRLQPYVKQLQQKYRDDRQQLNMKLMEFYRDNQVNPLASCLPLLLQIPIFIALFYVLKDWAEDRPGGDLSWLFGFIDDITVNISAGGWEAYLLLTFYVASQMFASKVMATSPDPKQRMMMMLLPVIFVPFMLIYPFPIGLVLYWITTNLWTLGQHVVVVKTTDTAKEVVLPPDDKGRQKTVMPKKDKQAARRNTSQVKGKPGGNGARPASPAARRNKRRR